MATKKDCIHEIDANKKCKLCGKSLLEIEHTVMADVLCATGDIMKRDKTGFLKWADTGKAIFRDDRRTL